MESQESFDGDLRVGGERRRSSIHSSAPTIMQVSNLKPDATSKRVTLVVCTDIRKTLQVRCRDSFHCCTISDSKIAVSISH